MLLISKNWHASILSPRCPSMICLRLDTTRFGFFSLLQPTTHQTHQTKSKPGHQLMAFSMLLGGLYRTSVRFLVLVGDRHAPKNSERCLVRPLGITSATAMRLLWLSASRQLVYQIPQRSVMLVWLSSSSRVFQQRIQKKSTMGALAMCHITTG